MKKLSFFLFIALVIAGTLSANAQRAEYDVIPLPKEVKVDSASVFVLKNGMGVSFDASNEEVYRNVLFFRQWVEETTGVTLKLAPGDKKAAIRMSLDYPKAKGEVESDLTEQQKEAYMIKVDKKGIAIIARQPIGLFRAAQTLRKSLPIVKNADKVAYFLIAEDTILPWSS